MPDYTKKNQKLSEYENINKPKEEDIPEWQKEDYKFKSAAELVEIAKSEVHKDLEKAREAESARVQEIQKEVDASLTELKKDNPDLDENLLFEHANKYKFSDLKLAHANMVEMKKIAKTTEKKVVKNINKRKADPINTGGGEPEVDEGYDPSANSHFSGAVEYLQRLKKD